MEPVTVTFTGRLEAFLEPLAAGQDGGRAAWQEAVALPTAASRWDRLLCEEALPLQLLPHQRRAVLQVLGPLEGRAILADEVGLGKTVEALLVARELMERGLAQTLLALVPAGLVGQWLWEAQRVGVPLERPGGTRSWSRAPRLITTLERARRPEVRELLTQRSWDVVVVDEAHRLQNPATLSFRLVDGLQKKYLLLLTATPMQNELRELYHLVTLLRPGHFHTLASFRRYFMLDRREPRNLPLLRERLREVMVRTTRREAALELPPRRVRVERLAPNESEAHLLAQALAAAREGRLREVRVRTTRREAALELPTRRVRVERLAPNEAEAHLLAQTLAAARDAAAALPQGKGRLALVTLLKQAASSPASLAQSLERLSRRGGMLGRERAARLLAWCRQVPVSTKLEAAVRLLQEPEPALVFTEFRGTQVALAQRLRQEGWEPLLLHGGMGSREREAVLRAFARGEGRVLVATDAGSVGHNLQFCRRVINVDLPWNPMRLEQRIGRVHRYGQLRPVEVVHLVLQGSLEESILRLLMEK